MTDYILVIITASSVEEAKTISDTLLNKRLAACTNQLSDVKSLYWWENSIQSSDEVMLLAKSRATQFDEIVLAVKEVHSYDIPEVLAIPILSGNPEYLNWIFEETGEKENGQ